MTAFQLLIRAVYREAEYLAYFLLIAGLVVAIVRPRIGEAFFAPIEKLGIRLAQHRIQAVFAVGLAAAILRLSLLWLLPVPVPRVYDEFSYLLAADTFAHGHVTNLTHPLAIFFDTIHINQVPTYMSKYPPAQGLVLAFGQLLGNPWIGILLSTAAMCGLTVWMLQGWVPPRWALLGGVLVLFKIGVFSYWMNSYWGGSVPACGGALVTGALPRVLRQPGWRNGLLLAFGVLLLANSRPFEGAIACIPVFAALLLPLTGTIRRPLPVILARVWAPLCFVGLVGGVLMGWYNWRLTGNPLLPAYTVNERSYYSATPAFVWQKPGAVPHFANAQLESYYNGPETLKIVRKGRPETVAETLDKFLRMGEMFVPFYLGPALLAAMLALPWILRNRRTRFLAAQVVLVSIALMLVIWFQRHYFAPVTASIIALPLQGIRHLRIWRFRGRRMGIGMSRVIVLCLILTAPFWNEFVQKGFRNPIGIEYRTVFRSRLEKLPGRHLVLVRYTPQHDALLDEWVFNDADIDTAKVIWAREIPGVDMQPLLDHFRGREVWIAEPDEQIPRLTHRGVAGPQSN